MLLAIPFAFPWMFGKMAGSVKQGLAVLSAMFALWFAISLVAMIFEANGNSKLNPRGVNQTATSTQAGGNMEGKETRFGPATSGLFASSTTGTSTGSVDSMHDSFTPLGGAAPLVNIMLGEVDPGGTGSGLYGMLLFALLSVFIAGLMVGRTPEYLGKKIQGAEMKLVVIYILFVPLVILAFTARVARDEASVELAREPRTARLDRDDVRVHLAGQQQRFGVRRPHRQHRLVQRHRCARDARRAVHADGPGARDRRARSGASSRRRRRPERSRPTPDCSPRCSRASW